MLFAARCAAAASFSSLGVLSQAGRRRSATDGDAFSVNVSTHITSEGPPMRPACVQSKDGDCAHCRHVSAAVVASMKTLPVGAKRTSVNGCCKIGVRDNGRNGWAAGSGLDTRDVAATRIMNHLSEQLLQHRDAANERTFERLSETTAALKLDVPSSLHLPAHSLKLLTSPSSLSLRLL